MKYEIVEGCRWSPLSGNLSLVFTDKMGAKIEIGDTLVYDHRTRPTYQYTRRHGEFVIETIPGKTERVECVVVGLRCVVERQFRMVESKRQWVDVQLKAIVVISKNHRYRIYRTGRVLNRSAFERDLAAQSEAMADFVERVDIDEIVTAETKTNDDAFNVGFSMYYIA
jgi:hypothetical protein